MPTPWRLGIDLAILAAWIAVLGALSVFALHRLSLLRLSRPPRRRPSDAMEPPAPEPPEWPEVTVQIPIYNEPLVVTRLVDAVARLDYPLNRLELQILDDSTDLTPRRAAAAARRARSLGLRVAHLRRRRRDGFKAGALAAGLARARGSLLAVFDADFVPPPDFLRRTVPCFADPAVGMVQARWGHLNRRHSLLTRLQAALLDSHFLVEHRARAAAGRFFNFNGTAGLWRRSCIEDAGGWQADTLTEDLDLSYRAQLRGWRFVFLPEVVAPAELPVRFSAFRSQQHRWAKGSAQTALKILPRIWRAPLPGHVRLEAFLHLTGNAAYPLLAALALLLWPALEARRRLAPGPPTVLDVVLFGPAALSVAAFWVAGQRRAGRGKLESLLLVPALFAFGAALAVTNARAVFEALLGRPSAFIRTPKSGCVDGRPRSDTFRTVAPAAARHGTAMIELLLALWCLAAGVAAARAGLWAWLPWPVLFALGFGAAGLAPWPETARRARSRGW